MIGIESSIGSPCILVSSWCFHFASIIAITTIVGVLTKAVLLVRSGIYRFRTSVQRIPHISDRPNQPRLRFDLEKLRDPDVACTFQATIGGKFAPFIGLSDEDMDIDTMITTYNTAVTDAASEILGKERRRKKPWVTKDILDLCDERIDLKKKRYETEGAKEYMEANRRIQKAVKKAREDWIGAQCK